MLYKRKDSKNWFIKIIIDGKTIHRSSGTSDRTEAEAVELKLHNELFHQVKLGAKPKYLWQEAVIRFINETPGKKSAWSEIYHFRWLSGYLDGITLDQITIDVIEQLIAEKLKTAGTTRTNRMTSLVSAVLNRAYKQWGWLDAVPYVRKFKEPPKRLRWFTQEEAAKIIDALPDHTAEMARFALATGLRESNVTHLEWSQVNLTSKLVWIHSDQSKSGKVIRVPLSDEAVAVLRRQLGKHQVRVFTYKGEPVEQVSTKAYRNTLNKLGIKDANWHTWRHTWASWHVQNGTPLNTLMELGGWSSLDMVMRYAHLAHEHLAEYVNSVSLKEKETAQKRHLEVVSLS